MQHAEGKDEVIWLKYGPTVTAVKLTYYIQFSPHCYGHNLAGPEGGP
jgi:hypothetical protein